MPTLNIQASALAYDDNPQAGSPLRRFIDWTRRIMGIAVTNPLDTAYTVAPGVALTVFNGTRTTTIDGTTAFALTKNPLLASTYRFAFTGGTDPGLRVDRSIDLSTRTVTISPNGDGTAGLLASGSGTPLAAVVAGDTLWIPGVSTGDPAGPFSPANEGAWVVLVGGNLTLVLARTGTFSGVGEAIAVTVAAQVSVFATAGVTIGDKVDITGGFATANQGTYTVTNVTSKFFEVSSARGLAAQSGVTPGAANLQFYTSLKKWVRLETTQESVVRFNGDTTNLNRVSPVFPGDVENPGWCEKFGATYSLVVVNRSVVPMTITVQSAE